MQLVAAQSAALSIGARALQGLILTAASALAGCQAFDTGVATRDSGLHAAARLDALAREAHERQLELFPVQETMERGAGPRQDRLELTFSAQHRRTQARDAHWLLAQLDAIPRDALSPSQQLSHRLLERQARLRLESLQYPFHQYYIFIQLGGGVAFDLVRLVGRQPFRDAADYRAWQRRLARYPEFLRGIEGVMRDGLRAGVIIPRPVIDRALPQLEALAPRDEDVAKSALWKPMTTMPATMAGDDRRLIEAQYRALLLSEVLPAIRSLAAFVRQEYLPRTRTTPGLRALPQGEDMYRYLVRLQTTTAMTPEEIHALGLGEVARIGPLLARAAAELGYTGPVSGLRPWMRAKPELYPFKTGQQVLDHLNRLHARIVPELPRLFARMPKARFEIRLTDPAIAASAPAQWYPPSDDGLNPGVFAMPVVDPTARSSVGLASLLAHEGMPGHHFDGSIKRESGLPEFRRTMWVNAFGEGWALYAESLGEELGLYSEAPDRLGRYLDELYRACRLVIDTGLHWKGWTREQAINYFIEQCGTTSVGAANEVDRYMAWPGQALGYKVGELTIQELRAQARATLGSRFDIRAFHETVLGEGHLPLEMLRERVERWVRAQADS